MSLLRKGCVEKCPQLQIDHQIPLFMYSCLLFLSEIPRDVDSVSKVFKAHSICQLNNPLCPNIKICIFLTVLFTFPTVLTRRIWQSRASLVGQDFLLFCAVMFDSGVIVQGEVRNQSISGPGPLNFLEITHPVAQIETEVP